LHLRSRHGHLGSCAAGLECSTQKHSIATLIFGVTQKDLVGLDDRSDEARFDLASKLKTWNADVLQIMGGMVMK
jgi:hypothetical protein